MGHTYKLAKYIEYIHPEQDVLLYGDRGQTLFEGKAIDIPKKFLKYNCCIGVNDPYLTIDGFIAIHRFSLELEIKLDNI